MTTTLIFIRPLIDTLWRFEFGDSLEPEGDRTRLLLRILEEYEHRHDEIGDLGSDAYSLLLQKVREADTSSPLHRAALEALGVFGKTEGWEDVANLLTSGLPDVSLAAIRTLGRMGKPASADAIVPFLSHASLEFRKTALVSIGKLARVDLLRTLEVAAGAEPEMRRLYGEAEKRTRATLQRDLESVFNLVLETEEYRDLIPLGLVLSNRILREFVDHDPPPRRRAHLADLCSLMRLCQASQKFIDLLADKGLPLDLRIACVSGLGRCRVEVALQLVLEQLSQPEVPLRAAAITSLGLIGSPIAFDPLLRLWDDADGMYRLRLRLALRRIGSSSSTESMVSLLSSLPLAFIPDSLLIDENLTLHREGLSVPAAAHLGSSVVAERQAASFVLALVGSADDVVRLRALSQQDVDEIVRLVAGHAAAALARRVGQ